MLMKSRSLAWTLVAASAFLAAQSFAQTASTTAAPTAQSGVAASIKDTMNKRKGGGFGMGKALELTADQKTKMKALHAQYDNGTMKALHEQLRSLNE